MELRTTPKVCPSCMEAFDLRPAEGLGVTSFNPCRIFLLFVIIEDESDYISQKFWPTFNRDASISLILIDQPQRPSSQESILVCLSILHFSVSFVLQSWQRSFFSDQGERKEREVCRLISSCSSAAELYHSFLSTPSTKFQSSRLVFLPLNRIQLQVRNHSHINSSAKSIIETRKIVSSRWKNDSKEEKRMRRRPRSKQSTSSSAQNWVIMEWREWKEFNS